MTLILNFVMYIDMFKDNIDHDKHYFKNLLYKT